MNSALFVHRKRQKYASMQLKANFGLKKCNPEQLVILG